VPATDPVPATDIVANLLRLSSVADDENDFLDRALPEMAAFLGGTATAIVRATPPVWTTVASHGGGRASIPTELAADALERMAIVTQTEWSAVPIGAYANHPSDRSQAGEVLLVRGAVSADALDEAAEHLGTALSAVRRRLELSRRVRRLEKILEITHQWHQADQMEVLLTRMAEAATELQGADRASIFLWDKRHHTLVGRPALGLAGGELRIPDDTGIVGQVVHSGEPRRVNPGHTQQEIDRSVDAKTGYQTDSVLCVPLVSPSGETLGAFELLNKQEGQFTLDDQRGLQELSAYAAIALANTQQLQGLLARNEQLVEQAAQGVELVGTSPPIDALRATIRRVADTDLAILILGENGTGKEVVAQSLHYLSRRRSEPFVAVNCAALTETLLESELFGHEKGAFTDAHETRVGKFELASGGTLFLDEIGDMSLGGQAKLLRVLEEKTVVRVGGSTPIHTEVRVLAATNQKLAELVRAKKFREDLYFRLNVVTLDLPPLRGRGDDILLLAEHFLRNFCRNIGRRHPKLTAAARKRLLNHDWPGNVRELRNLMERLAYLTSDESIDADDLAFILSPRDAGSSATIAGDQTLGDATQDFQKEYIRQTIDRTRGNVSEAAKMLGVHRSNLYRKMRQLGMAAAEEEDEE
jgi:Nif-specific regulatory protein